MSRLDVIGDEILCGGVVVARFDQKAWPTLRDRVEAIIDGAEPDMISKSEYAAAIDEAREEGFDAGKDRARKEFEAGLDKAHDDAYDSGYDAGRKRAMADMERARDAVRVENLINAVSQAHDALFRVAAKRYPTAKLGELKAQCVSSLGDIKRALLDWRT